VIKLSLTTDEIELLESHYAKARSRLIRERAHAGLLSHDGYSVPEMAKILRRDEDTVRDWLNAFVSTRIASIFHKYDHNANASKLTKEQREEIKKTLEKPPSDADIPKQFWSLPTLKEYISGTFGVVYESDRSYHYLLEYSGMSWKLPSSFDLRRDDVLVRQRMKEIQREIKKLKKDVNAIILSADECRINWETETRRAWLKRGEKTVFKVTRDKTAQNYFGAWNHRSGVCHLVSLVWQNQQTMIEALMKLTEIYANKRVVILWDNARWHKGKKLRTQLRKGKPLQNIHLINYAPYAPDMNPQEHVWKYGKEMISNQRFETFDDLKRQFESTIESKIFNYKIPEFVLR
jgi:transposase